MPSAVAIVVLDYPRLSESFIAEEILALEKRGLDALIVALRHPPEEIVSSTTGEIRSQGRACVLGCRLRWRF